MGAIIWYSDNGMVLHSHSGSAECQEISDLLTHTAVNVFNDKELLSDILGDYLTQNYNEFTGKVWEYSQQLGDNSQPEYTIYMPVITK